MSFSETITPSLKVLVVDASFDVRNRLVTLLSEVAGVQVVGSAGLR